VKINI